MGQSKIAAWTLLLGCTVFALCSCKSASTSNELVGTWGYDRVPATADSAFRFKADGTYEYWFKGARVNIEDSGTFSFDGHVLTLNRQRHVGTSGKVDTSPDGSKMNIRWISKDQLKMYDSQASNTWTRRPEGGP